MAADVMTAPALQIPDGPSGNPIISVEYEVYGQVQGKSRLYSLPTVVDFSGNNLLLVYLLLGLGFPKFAKDYAEGLGLGGWVKNTRQGTIAGKLEGPKDKIGQM